MFQDKKIIGYHAGTGFIYQLSGASKLLFFILVSVSAMISYDTRFLMLIALLSLSLFRISGIRLRDVRFVLVFALVFAVLNILMVYLFAPQYGQDIYKNETLLLDGIGIYNVTLEELFYLFNMALKYVCTIPLAVLFLMTTHPSQFASSLNQIGVPYKIAYSVSLTLRYIPDLQEELSSKAKLSQRIKGNLQIIIPLIFSSLDRIETIATAMELRRFGKNKKRTWYTYQVFNRMDIAVIALSFAFLLVSFALFFVNHGRFYNPWR